MPRFWAALSREAIAVGVRLILTRSLNSSYIAGSPLIPFLLLVMLQLLAVVYRL